MGFWNVSIVILGQRTLNIPKCAGLSIRSSCFATNSHNVYSPLLQQIIKNVVAGNRGDPEMYFLYWGFINRFIIKRLKQKHSVVLRKIKLSPLRSVISALFYLQDKCPNSIDDA